MDNTLQADLAACVDNIEYMDMAIARDQCNVAESKEDALNGAVRFLRTHALAIAELQARCEAAEADLAKLRAEIDAAPVGDAVAHANRAGEWLEVDGPTADELNALDGQRVALLRAGEG